MGRRAYSGRGVIERLPSITIRDLIDQGILKHGNLTASWENGVTETRGIWKEEIARVKYKVILENVFPPVIGRILLETKLKDGQEKLSSPLIEAQPVHFGGFRYYFRCALCGRLRKALYYGPFNRWDCRKCCDLVYEASREHRNPFYLRDIAETSRKKAEYLRKTKHPRLANRMEAKAEAQAEASEIVLDEHFFRRFGKFM